MRVPAARHSSGLVASSLRIFDLSLGQMLWSRRSVFLALLTCGPVVLAAAIRLTAFLAPTAALRVNGSELSGPTVFGMMIWLLYVRFIVPVLGVFYGTSLVADEVEDRTITYLFTRPIPRAAVVVGKFLAYLLCTALLVLPSVVIVYFLVQPMRDGHIGEGFPLLVADLGILVIGLAAYGAVFSAVGARLKRPVIAGLVFVFGWEPWVVMFPGFLRQCSVAYYLQALVPHAMPADASIGALLQVLLDVPSIGASLAMLAGIVAGGLWLAGRTIERQEYVLEQ